MKLNIKKTSYHAVLPTYGSKFAAGLDLYSSEYKLVPAHTRAVIHTGISMSWEGPNADEYYIRIAPRSGLSVKGIDIGAGVIDFDYTSEIRVCFINNSNQDYEINLNDRIAQMVFERINRFETIVEVEVLPETERGSGGFGSTGR